MVEKNIDDDADNVTDSSATRWEWTATILALALVLSLPAIVGLAAGDVVSLENISQAWFGVYSIIVLMAATWAFGEETLNAVQQARGKK